MTTDSDFRTYEARRIGHPTAISVNDSFRSELLNYLTVPEDSHVTELTDKKPNAGRPLPPSMLEKQLGVSKFRGLKAVLKKQGDVAASVVLTKEAAIPAIELMIRGMGYLGWLEEKHQRLKKQSSTPTPYSAGDTELLCDWIAKQVGADCYRLYAWDESLNRPKPVLSHNLIAKEFACGLTAVAGAPRRFLIAPWPAGPAVALEPRQLEIERVGSFCRLERVVASVAVLLDPPARRAGRMLRERRVLFLNFRFDKKMVTDYLTHKGITVRGGPQPVEGLQDIANHCLAMAKEVARTLTPFARYLNGWLHANQLTDGEHASNTSDGTAQSGLSRRRDEWLPTLLAESVDKDRPPGILPESLSKAIGSAFEPNPELRLARDVSPPVVARRDGDAVVYDTPLSPKGGAASRTSVKIVEDDFVADQQGLCAQAIASGRSMFVDYKDQTALLKRLERIRRQGHGSTPTTREAVVPVYLKEIPQCAISIEQPEARPGTKTIRLMNDDIVAIEAIGAAHASLRHLVSLTGKHPAIDWLLGRLQNAGGNLMNPDWILTRFSETLRLLTHSDIAYFIVYHKDLRLCKPRGISASYSLLSTILAPIGFGIDKDAKAHIDAIDRCCLPGTGASEWPVITESLETTILHAARSLAAELMPRADGFSWIVFAERIRAGTGNGPVDLPGINPPRLVYEYLRDYDLVPLDNSHHPAPMPNGVRWLGIDKHSQQRARGEYVPAETTEYVDAVTSAASAMTSLFIELGLDSR